MNHRLLSKKLALRALSFLLLLTPQLIGSGKKQHPGTLDNKFNQGGPVQGFNVQPMSQFLDIASGVALQKNNCGYQIIVAGDAVAKPQPLENVSNGCATPNVTACPTPPTACPNDCSGAPGSICVHCDIDGYQDERVLGLLRLNCDGSVDQSFGTNGNGKVYQNNADFSNTSGGIDVDSNNRILYGSNIYLSPNTIFDPADPDYGFTGSPSGDLCGFTSAIYPVNGLYYFTTAIGANRFLQNGALDLSYGTLGTFKLLPLVFGPNSFGDSVTDSKLDSLGRLVMVGQSFPDTANKPGDPTNGCAIAYPAILRLTTQGQLDSANFNSAGFYPGVTVEGNLLAFTTTFTDNSQSQVLNYGQYNALAFHTNNNSLNGKIVAVGDADVNDPTSFYPFTARIIVARYNQDGSIDTTFGIGGRMVISAINVDKQILCRAVAIDKNDNIYLGGDISDIGSGLPGAITAPSLTTLGDVVARLTANFLVIRLDKNGIPQDFGPASLCSPVNSPCQSTVFASCSSCVLNYNNSPAGFGSVRAVTTDFKGFDDAVFSLIIDDCNRTITAVGQASQDAGLQSQTFGFARYNLKDGSLDTSFGTGGLAMANSPLTFRTLARAAVAAPHDKIIAVGQSASAVNVTTTNFTDATQTNFAIARINS